MGDANPRFLLSCIGMRPENEDPRIFLSFMPYVPKVRSFMNPVFHADIIENEDFFRIPIYI